MFFVKRRRLKRKSVHKSIFAAAPNGFVFRGLQQSFSDTCASERFAYEKILNAKPPAECFSRQSGELFAVSVLKEHPYGNTFRCLAMSEIVLSQYFMDLTDIALISVDGYSENIRLFLNVWLFHGDHSSFVFFGSVFVRTRV